MAVKQTLNYNNLRIINRWFNSFMRVIEENSDDYAFYRGMIYSDSAENLHFEWLVSDIDGSISIKNMQYDDRTEDIFYGKKFSLKNDKEVSNAINELLNKIVSLPFSVSKIYFDVSSQFKSGKVFKDPKEAGSYIIYLIADTNNEHTMCVAGSVSGKEIATDWDKL